MAAEQFWTNDDGLNVRFGLERATPAVGGHMRTAGHTMEMMVNIDWAQVTGTDALLETHPLTMIPDGVYIIAATMYVKTAWAGSSSTLNIGLWNDDGDGTFSVNDLNGIAAAITLAEQSVIGEPFSCDGALVSVQGQSATTKLAGTGDRPLAVSVSWGTAAFTAGNSDLVIEYRYIR